MTEERLKVIWDLVLRPEAHGFRSECAELLHEAKRLRAECDEMRSIRFVGDYGPLRVADRLDEVARWADSSLHEVAGRMLRSLMHELAAAKDAAADAGAALAMLKRVTANLDVKCRLDHHGYCQEHNFAAPCPVPDAHKLTGGGLEYVPTCSVR